MNPSELLETSRAALERATPSELREAAYLYDAHKRGLGLEPALDVVAEYSFLPSITRYAWLVTAQHARGPAPSEYPGPTGRVLLGESGP